MTGKALRRIRKRLALSQAALAERMAVSPNTVARWERGELPIRGAMARLVELVADAEERGKE